MGLKPELAAQQGNAIHCSPSNAKTRYAPLFQPHATKLLNTKLNVWFLANDQRGHLMIFP